MLIIFYLLANLGKKIFRFDIYEIQVSVDVNKFDFSLPLLNSYLKKNNEKVFDWQNAHF